jgi:hypothetical protein
VLGHHHETSGRGTWWKKYQRNALRVLKILDKATDGGMGLTPEGWKWIEGKYGGGKG